LSRPSGAGARRFRGQLVTWIAADNRVVLLTEDHAAGLLPAGSVRVRFAAQAGKDEALRRAEDTGLPWTIAVALADPAKEQQGVAVRRQLLFWLFGAVAVLGAGGSYLGWRLIRRELALAQMQADIVAAVSHEFRTPLTSMRQVSGALGEGRVPDEDRRQAYYRALARATERLQRLVEDLLDFGRMQSNAMPYRMEPLNLAALAASTAADFAVEAAARGFTLHAEIPSAEVAVKGDAEALRRAVWNLLDNAVKYSGESHEAWVNLSRNGNEAFLRVTDRGIGIPRDEQREVFHKFFRGAASRQAHIGGSGIGLAMVDHIVRAHRGRITLESRPGTGSTFAIRLPLEV
jgi:signal transduction histidine kinase